MRTKKPTLATGRHIKRKLLGKRVKSEKLSISETSTEFFEDIPLYRGDKTRKLGKIHLSRSRKSKSTKA